ncbi:MAG TPA: hypothetical protein VF301_06875 [Ginsengibacter sp.]
MKKLILLSIISILFIEISCAQNIGIGTTAPNASSILEIKSGNKGALIPRTSTANKCTIERNTTDKREIKIIIMGKNIY